jgi:hypothetical protein
MQVYAVIGGWRYEGEHFLSLQLFDCKSAADAYAKQLTEGGGYDYATQRLMPVNQESALPIA